MTSSSGVINIHATGGERSGIAIKDFITDFGSQGAGKKLTKVGLNITAAPKAHAGVILSGAESNSFTGDTTITGNASLNLNKLSGTIAISGNLKISSGAKVSISRPEQIADHVRVSLISRGGLTSILRFQRDGGKEYLHETFRELFVEGKGEFDFGSGHIEHETRFLFLGDLIIGDDSILSIINWKYKRDHLLVRKDSVHLDEALKKIMFGGYVFNKVQKEDYDSNFWEITPLPEPATYGGLLVASTVSLSLLRRRLKACLGRSPS